MVSVSLGEDEGEEELEDDLAVVHAVPGNVRHEPVPKLGQSPANNGKEDEEKIHNLQEWAKKWGPGCENFACKFRLKW